MIVLTGCAKPGADIDALEAPSNRAITVTSDYPAVAMILMPGGRGLCTGTFVSPRALLTAADCTLEEGEYMVSTSFGTFLTADKYPFGEGVVGDVSDISLLIFADRVADARKGEIIPIGRRPSVLEKVRLVGFGCKDFNTRKGSGVKRTGTNLVYRLKDHIELLTPESGDPTAPTSRSLIGSDNRTGSCFGDSGGPMIRWTEERWELSGTSHAGGYDEGGMVSMYVDLNRNDNMKALKQADKELALGMFNPCQTSVSPPMNCNAEYASVQIERFLRAAVTWFLSWF